MYKEINTPFRTNEEKKIHNEEKTEKQNAMNNYNTLANIKNPPNTLIELKINEPTNKLMPQNNIGLPNQYPWVPVANPLNPNAFLPTTLNDGSYLLQPYNYPIIKKYNISLGGPGGDVTKVADIFEDFLPTGMSISQNSFNTLKERKNINDYIRGMFIKIGDGEEIILGKSSKLQTNHNLINLLSHLKLLEINPYHYNKLTNNPYKTMPTNFCMYRSCYPIRMDNGSVSCAKSNIGMNVRIYGTTIFDEYVKKQGEDNKYESDLWRDIEYYKLIKQEIIKSTMVPNFIQMYAYYEAKNVGIDFYKFELLKNGINIKSKTIEKYNSDIFNKKYLNAINEDIKFVLDKNSNITEFLLKYKLISYENSKDKNKIDDVVEDLKKTKKLRHYNGTTYDSLGLTDNNIVMLTEAPTQNILNWATKTYQFDSGPINKMLQSGYHSKEEWESVIFQLLCCFIALFSKKIMFSEFSLESNVFIKDLQTNTTNIGHWKYIINGFEFNVPNYGFIVLIDSSYKDLTDDTIPKAGLIEHKILCELWKDNLDKIIEKTLENMKICFDKNNFSSDFIQLGGQKPHDDIIKLLNSISNNLIDIGSTFKSLTKPIDESNYNKIKTLLLDLPTNLMKDTQNFNYIHNRVGTIVKDNEINMLMSCSIARSLDGTPRNFKPGELIAYSIGDGTKIYALFKGCDETNINIISTNEIILNQSQKKQYNIYTISKASSYFIIGTIEQNYQNDQNLSEIETYRLD